jgi:polar amino acid transport system substrate-binding protein
VAFSEKGVPMINLRRVALPTAILIALWLALDQPASIGQPSAPANLLNLRPYAADTDYLSLPAYMIRVVNDLTAGGTLRAAINVENPVIATKDPASGELRGVAVTLGRELASTLKARFVPIEYRGGAGNILDGARTGAWDAAFLAIDPARSAEVDFTAPYMLVDNTLLVPAGSTIRSLADADRTGMRIAALNRGAADLYLSGTLQRAQLVRTASRDAALALVRSGQADALADNRQVLVGFAAQLPGSTILLDGFLEVRHAIAVRKGRRFGLKFVGQFVEFAKASGGVQRALEQAGVRGVKVTPPASAP